MCLSKADVCHMVLHRMVQCTAAVIVAYVLPLLKTVFSCEQ